MVGTPNGATINWSGKWRRSSPLCLPFMNRSVRFPVNHMGITFIRGIQDICDYEEKFGKTLE